MEIKKEDLGGWGMKVEFKHQEYLFQIFLKWSYSHVNFYKHGQWIRSWNIKRQGLTVGEATKIAHRTFAEHTA